MAFTPETAPNAMPEPPVVEPQLVKGMRSANTEPNGAFDGLTCAMETSNTTRQRTNAFYIQSPRLQTAPGVLGHQEQTTIRIPGSVP